MALARSRGLVVAALVVSALVPAATVLAQPGDRPPVTARSPSASASTTVADQVDLSLTVYNTDLALVRDVRQLTLPAGTSTLRFGDVAAAINPATVLFRSLTEPAALTVLEQNYEYDLLEPERLLRKYVGRDITIVRERQDGGTMRAEETQARLLAYNNGPVWKIGSEIVTGLRADQLRFPELPENLYSHPTLVWMLENAGATRHRVEASYLSARVNWNADYVLTIGRDDKAGDLAGWVTLKNQSGAAYRNARLQLIAGQLNRAAPEHVVVTGRARAIDAIAAAPPMEQEAFSEYHLYTLQRRTTINENETKQLSLLTSPNVPIEKRYVVDGQGIYYRGPSAPGAPIKNEVKVFYRFRNDGKSGLGMPLPAGVVRVYQADSTGGVQFAGEDRVDHTPKDEVVDLHTGNAFDIVCERKQLDFRRLSNTQFESELEITLRNHKDAPVTVEVNEPIGGDWDMLSSTHKFVKTAAFAARFEVPVAKDGTAVLRYRVRARY
jgi:hypothetical protein